MDYLFLIQSPKHKKQNWTKVQIQNPIGNCCNIVQQNPIGNWTIQQNPYIKGFGQNPHAGAQQNASKIGVVVEQSGKAESELLKDEVKIKCTFF